MSVWQWYKKIPLLTKMLVALGVGIILGIIFGEKISSIKFFGTIFLNLLKMIAIPLIIVNVIGGIASMDDPKSFGRGIGGILLYYTATTIIAIIVGLAVAGIMKPGIGFVLSEPYTGSLDEIPSLGNTLINLIPTNIFSTLADGSLDKIVIFCAIIGAAGIFIAKDKKKIFTDVIDSFAAVLNKVIGAIMLYAPIGVCALIANAVGVNGSSLFGNMAKYLGCSYISILIQIGVYSLCLVLFSSVSPVKFFKHAAPVITTGLSTSSSLACIPVNMQCADNLGVPSAISKFTIPLGAQFNKDGNGIMLAVTFMFAAQCVGETLSLGVLLRAILIALILTTGAGGVPGGGIISLAIMCDSFGLPLEVAGVISGIFVLIDMPFTMMNVLGDLVGTTIVGLKEKKRMEKTAAVAHK